MEFRLLGPLEVVVGDRVVSPRAAKQRALLALLLLHANRPLSAARLIEDLWDGRAPTTASKVLQTYVSQLRRLIGGETIVSSRGGYELRVGRGELDVERFERLVTEAMGLELEEATERLRHALALWRGPPLSDFAYEGWARPEIARLEELHLAALRRRIDGDLGLGRARELIGELELLVAENPLDEALRAQLMLALYRSGRQAEALAAYRDARHTLVETLGIEPTLDLRRLERAILDQDPSLDLGRDSQEIGASYLEDRSSSFVGRTRELREIRALLGRDEVRLLTLTGAAGSGKTRLAVEVTSTFEGAVLIELARITDAGLVARTIADRLEVTEQAGCSAREGLLEHLRDRHALLLLDNFEHVLSAAPLVRELLAGAPRLKLLVTSRAPLGVPEERVYSIPPLELPDRLQHATLSELGETEAIRLFVDRARIAQPNFDLSDANVEPVVELCVRLDGLPLALELAAARCNLLSPRALLERLDSRLDLLRAEPGSGHAERQWTLRGAIEWSYGLLEPEQQQLFTSLGVFVGGFTLTAAELAAEQPDFDVLEGVELLFRSNLLTTARSGGDEPRVGMLETIREYALERLAARGDGELVRRRHAVYCLEVVEEAERGLVGSRQPEWLERLDAELDNIRAALTWAVDAQDPEVGLRIGSALWRYWQLRDHLQEGREVLEALLALGSGSPSTRAKAQTMLASLVLHDDLETSRRLLEESLAGHRREGDIPMFAHALGLLGMAAVVAGETDTALRLTLEAIEVARGGVSPYIEAAATWQVGVCLAIRGELDGAKSTLEEAVALAVKLGDARGMAGTLMSLGGVALMRGDQGEARRLFDESLNIHRSLDNAWGVTSSLSSLAFVALEAGDTEKSRELLWEALAIERENGHHPWLANNLEISARLAATDGDPTLAVRLYARAALVRRAVTSWVHYELGWPDPTRHLADLRSRIGETSFEEEWERGRAMTLLEAIDQASSVADGRDTAD